MFQVCVCVRVSMGMSMCVCGSLRVCTPKCKCMRAGVHPPEYVRGHVRVRAVVVGVRGGTMPEWDIKSLGMMGWGLAATENSAGYLQE